MNSTLPTVQAIPQAPLANLAYQQIREAQLPLLALKLVIGYLSNDKIDMEVIKGACEDSGVKELILAILQKINTSSKEDLRTIEVDFGDRGKFRLENNGNDLEIIKCGDNFSGCGEVLGIFPRCTLERLVDNFKIGVSTNEWLMECVMVQRSPINQRPSCEDDFVIIEKNKSPSETDLGSWSDDDVVLMEQNTSSTHSTEGSGIERSYLQSLISKTESEESTLGSGFFETAFGEFVQALNRVKFTEENQVSTNDFVIYNHVLKGEEKAKQFIATHQTSNTLVLVPYGVTNRTFGEDHIVLLAVKSNETAIIDPKWGIFLGEAVPWKDIKGLLWQAPWDTNNCGFYVYHMLTNAVEASVAGNFIAMKEEESLSSTLHAFFKQKNQTDPSPKEIRREMRKLYDAMQLPKEASSTISTTTLSKI